VSGKGKDPNRVLAGRIGGFLLHSKHDSCAITARARETFLRGFEKQVDPAGELSPKERGRRAEQAKRAHMARLAWLSAKSRTKTKNAARPVAREAALEEGHVDAADDHTS